MFAVRTAAVRYTAFNWFEVLQDGEGGEAPSFGFKPGSEAARLILARTRSGGIIVQMFWFGKGFEKAGGGFGARNARKFAKNAKKSGILLKLLQNRPGYWAENNTSEGSQGCWVSGGGEVWLA